MTEEKFFDTNKDITKDDWKEIKSEIEKGFDSTDDFLNYAFAVKILDPKMKIEIGNKADEIKEQIDDMPVPEFSSYEKENRPPLPPADDLAKLYSAIATIKIINPLLQLGTKELWKGAVESLKELKNLNDSKDSRKVETLTSLAFYMKIADPSFDVDDAIGNAGWENIQKSFYGFKNIDFAAKIKVINPKIDLKLNEGDWQLMKENLSKARTEKNYYVVDGFTPLAATMKILAADKTIITDKGLEIK